MAPDFEYFLSFRLEANIGHTLPGFLLFNLPVCLVFAYLFHRLIKLPLVLHLPRLLNSWYLTDASKKWQLASVRQVIIFCYSAILGMFTHVIWDSFTHQTGVMVLQIPSLAEEIALMGYGIPVYKLLQHGSSLIGVLLIILSLYRNRAPVSSAIQMSQRLKWLFFLLVLSVSGALFMVLIQFGMLKSQGNVIGLIVVLTINCLVISLTAICVLSRLWLNKDSPSRDRT
jgi:hypothetical protein